MDKELLEYKYCSLVLSFPLRNYMLPFRSTIYEHIFQLDFFLVTDVIASKPKSIAI